jgi:uncharacterized protein
VPFINIQYPYLWLYQRILFGETASLNAVDAINGSDVPVLIIHGTEDEFVGYEGSSIISKWIMLLPIKNGYHHIFNGSYC